MSFKSVAKNTPYIFDKGGPFLGCYYHFPKPQIINLIINPIINQNSQL